MPPHIEVKTTNNGANAASYRGLKQLIMAPMPPHIQRVKTTNNGANAASYRGLKQLLMAPMPPHIEG